MYKLITKLFFLLLIFSTIININAQNTKLKIGDRIPYFSLYDQHGVEFNSKECIGKQALVIFFYPRINSPVCTKQICAFRDNHFKFKKLNAKVIGLNPADLIYHTDISVKNKVPYPLLTDKDNKIQKMFGVPRIFLSSKPKRYTFIVDKYGIIKQIYFSKKNINSHIEESLKILKEEEE